MKKYWVYLKYVCSHKWFVFLECCRVGLFWRGIFHDLDKFLPSMFIPYARYFDADIHKGKDKKGFYKPSDTGDIAFEMAWLKHCRRNKHHWQYWVVPEYPEDKVYEMPWTYVLECICDWRGAGKAQGTMGNNKFDWFDTYKSKMKLHENTISNIYLALNMLKDV